MVLPAGVDVFTLTFGNAVDMMTGQNLIMTLDITPSTSVVHLATGIPLLRATRTFQADPGQEASVTLPKYADATFSDGEGHVLTEPWSYLMKAKYYDNSTVELTGDRITKILVWDPATSPDIVDFDKLIGVDTETPGVRVDIPDVWTDYLAQAAASAAAAVKYVVLSEADYVAMASHDAGTLYLITS